ncbi:hypothetical protein HNR46_004208 [Haloferula luteola]|uniref:NADAR domain-containing protein n=1 Tax=Haloferula luteola TaxID=595692 RepID=A0A840VH68_9BACT|nr:NADAR family protein [Haloferula luteola]MBB5353938.1 hypothetical protein [Haloferula luteola]
MQPTEARSVDELVSLVESGGRPKFVFFWGHTPRRKGSIDQSCFSNWFPSRFSVDGVSYPTTEHYMMAEKARLFGDARVRDRILQAGSPGAAKRLGREVAGFDESTWIANRFRIVVSGNLAKFSQHRELGAYLTQTGERVLVEASPRDRIWGIGLSKDESHAENPRLWKGLNLLGFALMEVRFRLKQES